MMPDDALAELTPERCEPRWREALSVGSTQRVWIAEREGRGLGFAAWGPPRDPDLCQRTAELLALYLEQDAARTGVARRLLDEALCEMRGHLYERAVLWVLEANHRARRFYERSGWEDDGARKVVHRCGTDLESVRYSTVIP